MSKENIKTDCFAWSNAQFDLVVQYFMSNLQETRNWLELLLLIPSPKFSKDVTISFACFPSSRWHNNQFPFSCAFKSDISICLTELVELLVSEMDDGV